MVLVTGQVNSNSSPTNEAGFSLPAGSLMRPGFSLRWEETICQREVTSLYLRQAEGIQTKDNHLAPFQAGWVS
jgi:hypothetical protein